MTLERRYFFSRRCRITVSYPILMKQAPLERGICKFSETCRQKWRISIFVMFLFYIMTSKITLNANNLRTVHHIDALFWAGRTKSYSTHFACRQVFRKYFRYARMTSFKISKFNFSATVSNIYAQLTPSTSFRKYFRFARMTSLKIVQFNFTAAIENIYAQFAQWKTKGAK